MPVMACGCRVGVIVRMAATAVFPTTSATPILFPPHCSLCPHVVFPSATDATAHVPPYYLCHPCLLLAAAYPSTWLQPCSRLGHATCVSPGPSLATQLLLCDQARAETTMCYMLCDVYLGWSEAGAGLKPESK